MNVTAPLCPARHDSAYPVRTTRSCRSLTLFKTSASISEARSLTARDDACSQEFEQTITEVWRVNAQTQGRSSSSSGSAAVSTRSPSRGNGSRFSSCRPEGLTTTGPHYHVHHSARVQRRRLVLGARCLSRPAALRREPTPIRTLTLDSSGRLGRGRRNVDLAGSPGLSRKTLSIAKRKNKEESVRSGNDLELMVG
jgi:hypothetical protein